ncbi:MAG TPA: efflux RND transporter periplasmic adaptor subunit [Bacteroidota bacterium]|jgi:RND family efflux transporter MFP subunit|nr:efflux RND transporter periplasmic adaptor subunit [Bacteroidota bacterium]
MSTETEKADLSALRISHEKREGEGGTSMRVKVLVAGGLLVLLAGGYFVMRNNLTAGMEVELTTATLTFPSQANAVLSASGYVVAQQKAAVASKGTGRLVYLAVEEGDRVKKNQVIARLEDQDVTAALEKTNADFELAKADLEDAELSLERQQTMYKSGLTSKAELDAAMARYRRVKASIRSAEASVRSAEVSLENTRIRAPFDGTVLTKNADVGEVVAPFGAASNSRGAVVTMADMSSLEVEADVSESNITRVKPGQPCEIVLDAYPEKRYQGVVSKIVPTADRAKATVLTKVKFKERDDRVLPEMSAKVTFLSREIEGADTDAPPQVTVPTSAVVSRGGADVVLLVREDRLTEVPVKIGNRIGTRIEIRDGIVQGDVVVLRPDETLSTGSRIVPKK